VEEHLPGKCKALSSVPSTRKKKKKGKNRKKKKAKQKFSLKLLKKIFDKSPQVFLFLSPFFPSPNIK
jgi:hypothetical protein